MRLRASQASYGRVDRSFVTVQRLMLENARLSRVYRQAKDMAAEYEVLRREGDHRIKNSLQIVASLLRLQARREMNAGTRDALNAATARVEAVARIHDALQLGAGEDVVDIGALIAAMSKSLHAMAGEPSSIEIVVHAEPIPAPLKLAQPIVLAVNELVINALRHAFPDDSGGGAVVITVARTGDWLEISVADNGAGLPAGYAEGRGYGMTIVRAMIAKVGGRLDANSSAGARFTLSAPLLKAPASAPSHFVPDQSPLMAAC